MHLIRSCGRLGALMYTQSVAGYVALAVLLERVQRQKFMAEPRGRNFQIRLCLLYPYWLHYPRKSESIHILFPPQLCSVCCYCMFTVPRFSYENGLMCSFTAHKNFYRWSSPGSHLMVYKINLQAIFCEAYFHLRHDFEFPCPQLVWLRKFQSFMINGLVHFFKLHDHGPPDYGWPTNLRKLCGACRIETRSLMFTVESKPTQIRLVCMQCEMRQHKYAHILTLAHCALTSMSSRMPIFSHIHISLFDRFGFTSPDLTLLAEQMHAGEMADNILNHTLKNVAGASFHHHSIDFVSHLAVLFLGAT